MTKDEMSNNIIKLRPFDWDKAKHFYYVAKFKSVSEAAKFINTSQPALSRKVILLEETLNCKLLIRNRHGVIPTRKGEELLAILEHTFIELGRFNYNHIPMSHKGQKRRIKISTTHPVAAYILSEHIINYNKIYPEIYFDIISDDQLIDIVVNDVDISLRPYNHDAVQIRQDYTFVLQKKLYASKAYINKYGEPKKVEDLSHHHVMTHAQPDKHPYSDVNWILRLGMSEGKLNQPVLTSNSLECLVEAAQQGLGIIANYPQMRIIKNSGLINILPHVIDEPIKWYIGYPNYLSQDEQINNFKEYITNQLT